MELNIKNDVVPERLAPDKPVGDLMIRMIAKMSECETQQELAAAMNMLAIYCDSVEELAFVMMILGKSMTITEFTELHFSAN